MKEEIEKMWEDEKEREEDEERMKEIIKEMGYVG